MKNVLKTLALAALCSSLFFTSCKKKEDNTPSITDSTALAANADDESTLTNEQESSLQEVDDLFNNSASIGGRIDFTRCGATIDSSVAGQRTISYDGVTACGTRGVVRSGNIVVKLFNATRWRQAGAVLQVTFNNYSVKRANGKVITYNGAGKVYNVSGGLRREVQAGTINQVVHRIRMANVQMTHNNKTFSDWGVAKTRTYSANGDLYTITVKGDTNATLSGAGTVGSWGTGRYGEHFYTDFQQPIVANSSCGFDAPISGKKFHNGLRRDLTVTFGVDASGNPVTTAGACPGYYKWEFVGPVRSYSGVVAYN